MWRDLHGAGHRVVVLAQHLLPVGAVQRPVDLVFVGADHVVTARLTPDARKQLPLAGQTVESAWTVAAPAGLKAGQSYKLHLRLPDPSSRLATDERYSIRLANNNVWDPTTGRHNLGATAQARARRELGGHAAAVGRDVPGVPAREPELGDRGGRGRREPPPRDLPRADGEAVPGAC